MERIEESGLALINGGGYWVQVTEDIWIYIDDEEEVVNKETIRWQLTYLQLYPDRTVEKGASADA